MYSFGGPLGGGVVAGTLARTGLDTFATTAVCAGLVIAGLFALRTASMRRSRADA
ncbi:hypothetical protein [Leifsonia xyli]|uniref:hypothetical protein n=1 Tax=Leifsonia xyli TaxID=1575 RepID=UPI000A709D4C|nr:hypothetical protein [Leifsonia xyli]